MQACLRCGEQNPPRARFCTLCGAPLEEAPPDAAEVRKTVTLLFCDVTDSTPLGERLDPESLRQAMTRYFELARAVLDRHGGTVEKFIGDAVMAVFGIPTVHEDDALRAVRAAVELQDRLRTLNDELERTLGVRLAIRTGLNTGEVLAGDPSAGQNFATGAAVVVAERLEKAAPPGEILISDATFALVRDAVETEPVGPVELKGTSAPVGAWRVVRVAERAPGVARRFDSTLVDRERELAHLLRSLEEARSCAECRVVTVVGEPGVGKSRLVSELAAQAGPDALVLEGRCPTYGEGVTFWPIAEILHRLAALTPADGEAAALSKLAALVPSADDAELIAAGTAAAAGLGGTGARNEEVFWAVRRLFEELARERPLLVVLDDVQWAEPTLLELVDYLAGWTRDSPVLLCCLARPDLHELHPSWSATAAGDLMRLDPLEAPDVRALVAGQLERATEVADGTLDAIVRATGGNPLFVEELVRMLVDDGLLVEREGRWEAARDLASAGVPATIQALLGARLDLLPEDERTVLQRASAIGEVFPWSAVTALTPDPQRGEVGSRLQALVRRRLIKPAAPGLSGEDSFEFSHILLRDAAYDSMPKRLRARLHEAFADWVDERAAHGLAEREELTGYHLEQAFECLQALGVVDETARAVAGRAGTSLASAGRRALARGDGPAAVNLLERAIRLLRAGGREPLEEQVELGMALKDTGGLGRAGEILDEAVEAAWAAGDARIEARAGIERAFLRLYTSEVDVDELIRIGEHAVPIFERTNDDSGLASAWSLLASADFIRCRVAAMEASLERALVHAERAGDARQVLFVRNHLGRAGLVGPTPVDEAIRRCEELLELGRGNRTLEGRLATILAYLEAMRGRFDEARAHYAHSHAILEEAGLRVLLGGGRSYSGAVELLAGDPEAAERELRLGVETLEAIGEKGNLSTVSAFLAEALVALGRDEEAERYSALSEETATAGDLTSQVIWRSARAKVRARAGDYGEAELLARDAVALAEATDSLTLHGDALTSLAEVLRTTGRDEEAVACLARALRLYEAKGNAAAAGRARALLPVA